MKTQHIANAACAGHCAIGASHPNYGALAVALVTLQWGRNQCCNRCRSRSNNPCRNRSRNQCRNRSRSRNQCPITGPSQLPCRNRSSISIRSHSRSSHTHRHNHLRRHRHHRRLASANGHS